MFTEENISYWQKQVDPIFKKSYDSRSKIVSSNKTFFQGLEGTKRNPILVFSTIPTYSKKSNSILKGKSDNPKVSKNYKIKIQLVDINSWIKSKTIENYTQEEFDGMLDFIDIKMDCSCYSFHWWGIRYQLSNLSSAIYSTNISDPVRSLQLQKRPTLCKHLIYILKIFRLFFF